jgi:hypothetical protein
MLNVVYAEYHFCLMMLMLSAIYAECHLYLMLRLFFCNAECIYTEYHLCRMLQLLIVMLSVVMLNAIYSE